MIVTRPTKRQAKEEKARRALQRRFTKFKKVIYKRYEHAAHLDALDSALEQVTEYVESGGERGIGLLIVEMPPRHGKTLTVSKLFPIWHLGRNPSHRVMLVSYGHTLAHKNSRAARNMMKSPWYNAVFPNVELAKDSAAADAWNIEGDEGGCDAMGITGGATGKGAHVLIVDDPIKNRQEASSETYRERVWEAYQNDLFTRLEPGGAIILMMTRWDKDDLIGRVLEWLKEHGDTINWHRLRLPAIAEDENDALGRKPGEALWSWRYPVDVLNRIAKAVGRYAWAALYQQRPQPRTGGMFKWADIDNHRTQSHPSLIRVVIAVDPSGSAAGDEVGIGAAGVGYDGHVYVLEDHSLQASPKQWATTTVTAYKKHKADRVVGEKNYGGDMVEYTLRTVDEYISYSHVTATRGKELRAEPVASLYEQGLVHHVGNDFDLLEDEMTTWKQGDKSPNRMDWLVWAITELMFGGSDVVEGYNPTYDHRG
jgi:hypothetical protein